jgi:hypothetical protein
MIEDVNLSSLGRDYPRFRGRVRDDESLCFLHPLNGKKNQSTFTAPGVEPAYAALA